MLILDNKFMLANGDNIFEYRGWAKSNAWYDEASRMWIARHITKPGFLATSRAPKASLLLGPHEWTVHNDSEKCTVEKSYVTMMLMTACNDSEFTCSDGSCVRMANRCDGKVECSDGTDETSCTIVVPDVGYNKLLVPPPRRGNRRLEVKLSMNIINILEISEVEESLKIRSLITRQWYDKRLTYHDLKENENFNTLSTADQNILWYPSIQFDNVAAGNQWTENELRSSFYITRDTRHDFKQADITSLNNIYLYDGLENYLTSSREFTVIWICTYQMHWYPFDTQTCTMELSIVSKFADFSDLLASNLTYSGDQNLAQYFVRNMSICSTTKPNGSKAVVVVVSLGRPIISTALTVFIPTSVLLIISHLAEVAEERYFDMVIQVNLTVLLVLATL
jgi:hypothetical protein